MKKRGFTLIELMIVLMLMGIVYGIYFFSIVQAKEKVKFSLENMKEYLQNQVKNHSEGLRLVYNFDKKIIYLIDKKKDVLKIIDFDEAVTCYDLKENEQLEVKEYEKVEIDGDYFEPAFIYENIKDDIFSNIILNNTKNQWYYYNSYFGNSYEVLLNQTELIDFIKKKEYLPMYAGKPE